ncbi:MAG: hypothetical protein KA444_01515 [Bacteroidia bacterium]|nr:hypothetical protein [Bacteroidia bacterium]
MKNKRRLLLIFGSVAIGSLMSLWIMKKRMGGLRQSDYMQVGFNFLFAAAVVVGVSIFLQRMNDKERKKEEAEKKKN